MQWGEEVICTKCAQNDHEARDCDAIRAWAASHYEPVNTAYTPLQSIEELWIGRTVVAGDGQRYLVVGYQEQWLGCDSIGRTLYRYYGKLIPAKQRRVYPLQMLPGVQGTNYLIYNRYFNTFERSTDSLEMVQVLLAQNESLAAYDLTGFDPAYRTALRNTLSMEVR